MDENEVTEIDLDETDSGEIDLDELNTDIELPEEETVEEDKNYHIFIRTIERPNDESLWAIYKETDEDGNTTPYVAVNASEIDSKVEELINTDDGMIRPKDLLVANVIPWIPDAVSELMSNNLDLTDEPTIDEIVSEIADEVLFSEENTESETTEETEETTEEETIHYHIMERIAQRPNNNSLWKLYKQEDVYGRKTIFNTNDYDVINAEVESMVNTIDGKYRPRDIMIISIDEWEVDAVSEVMANNIILATEQEIDELVNSLAEDILNAQESENNTPEAPENNEEDNDELATTEDIDNLMDDLINDLGL